MQYESTGENIAAGQWSPEMAVTSWWNSDGHRRNMLEAYFTHLGTGYSYADGDAFGHYWIQLFTGNCTPDSIGLNVDTSIPYILTTDQSIEELGFELTVNCHHGTSYMPVIEEMCSPIDKSLIGQDQKVTISYGGKSVDVLIRVQNPLPFVDVDSNGWYYDWVSEVYYNGIMTGLDETHFGPADKINREQMAVMMYRFAQYLKVDTSGRADYSYFTDAAQVNEFAQDAMSWAVHAGIISGKDNGTRIDPQGNANRAECATIIMRFLNYCGM